MEVEDNLYSYEAENALSANMGRELREMIEQVDSDQTSLEERVNTLENSSGGSGTESTQCNCETKIWTQAIE